MSKPIVADPLRGKYKGTFWWALLRAFRVPFTPRVPCAFPLAFLRTFPCALPYISCALRNKYPCYTCIPCEFPDAVPRPFPYAFP